MDKNVARPNDILVRGPRKGPRPRPTLTYDRHGDLVELEPAKVKP